MKKNVEADNLVFDVKFNKTWWPACWRKYGIFAGLPTQSITRA